MAVNIKLKRSSVPGRIPTTSSLELGEIALNTYDGKAYFKQQVGASETVVALATSAGSGSSVVSASYANFATNAGNATTAGSATTAGFASTAGNASTADSATSASYALTASFASNLPLTASYANNAASASFALTASFASNIPLTASYANNAASASYALTASFTPNSNSGSYSVSASYALTASYASNVPLTSSYAISASNALTSSYAIDFNVSGNLVVGGNITAQTLHVQTITSSVIYSSGSNIFGDSTADTQTLNGTVSVSGSLNVTGSATINNLTGSLYGTSSWASNANNATTASYANNATTASYAATATSGAYAVNATTASYANVATSASYAATATSGAYAVNATTASYATISTYTSEWILGAVGASDYTFTGPGFTGSANDPTIYLVRGQQYKFTNTMGMHPFRIQTTINGSVGPQYNNGVVNNDVTNGTLTFNVPMDVPEVLYYQCTAHAGMGGPIYILDQSPASSSYAVSASYAISASYSKDATTSSYALTASFTPNSNSGSYALSASYALTASYADSASNATSASYAVNGTSGSYALTASYAETASYALSASYSNNSTSASFASTASYVSSNFQYEVHVSQIDGNDTTGDGSLLKPVASITKALTLTTAQRRVIVLHPGGYTENPTISSGNITIQTTELTGGNTVLSGTLTIPTSGSGARISGFSMDNLAITGTAQAYISNCTVNNNVVKSSSGYVEIINSELQCISGIQISGAGITIINGNKNVGVAVSNASAQVIIKGCNSVVTPSASAGNLAIVDCIVTALGGNGITITGASTTLTLANSQVLVQAGNNVAPISVAGIYSIINTIYDKPNSTLTGTSTNSVDYFQYINADNITSTNGLTVTGSITVSGSVINTLTSSFAISSSQATSASFATSASQAQTAATASFITASNVFGPFGSNSVISASFATTASYALNASSTSFPYTGSAQITGSLGVTGSVSATTVQSNVFLSPQIITEQVTVPSGFNGIIIGDPSISGSITISSGSNVTIADFSIPNLQQVTNIGSTTTNSITAANFITTSDRRLKSNIKQIENPFEVLDSIKSYEYVKDGKKDAGFIAQEVQETIPYAVFENEEGMLTMSDRPLLAYLYAAVMELKEENKQLKKELKSIKP